MNFVICFRRDQSFDLEKDILRKCPIVNISINSDCKDGFCVDFLEDKITY